MTVPKKKSGDIKSFKKIKDNPLRLKSPLNENQSSQLKKNLLKKRRRSKKVYVIVLLLVLLLASLSLVLLVEMGILDNPLKKFNLAPQLYPIKDDCALILGNLIHKIKDDGGCEMACKTECNVRDMEYHSSEFIEYERDCHMCNCYCI